MYGARSFHGFNGPSEVSARRALEGQPERQKCGDTGKGSE